MTVSCHECNRKFYIKPSHWKMGYGKYCSRACYDRRKLKGKIVSCEQCGEKFYATLKQLTRSKSKRYFCKKSCYLSYQVFDQHPNWKNGKSAYLRLMRKNRVQICMRCKIKNTRVLIVHHIDQNRQNNVISNLVWLCRNCHYLVHHYEREAIKLLVPMV